jgi:hypothetical protein
MARRHYELSPCLAERTFARNYAKNERDRGSIFGTAISQTRNEFDPDNFNHCVLIITASAVYFTIKIRGMAGAYGQGNL